MLRSSFSELRYNYQWYLKRLVNQKHPPYDMTDVVHSQVYNGLLSVVFKDMIYSDRAFSRAGMNEWKIDWQNGKLSIRNRGEIPVFHFVDLKSVMNIPDLQPACIPERFTLDRDGFQL
jgi:hypothetical protein